MQVVRDPRAVAFSWLRKKYAADRIRVQHMEQFSAVTTSRMWMSRHIAAELIRRRSPTTILLVRYEDLVVNPLRVIETIVDRINESVDVRFVSDGRAVETTPNHTVAGNPVRLRSGWIPISEHHEWKECLPWHTRAAVTFFTWPLMLRYGYALKTDRIPTRIGH